MFELKNLIGKATVKGVLLSFEFVEKFLSNKNHEDITVKILNNGIEFKISHNQPIQWKCCLTYHS